MTMHQYKNAMAAISHILDDAINWFRGYWPYLFPAALVTVACSRAPHLLHAYRSHYYQQANAADNLVFLIASLVFILLSCLFFMAVIVQIEGIRRKRWVNIMAATSYSLKKLPIVVVSWLLYMLLLMLITIVGIIGAAVIPAPNFIRIILGTLAMFVWVYFAVRLSFFMLAALIDQNGVVSSLGYSAQLINTSTKWFTTVATLTVGQAIASVMVLLPSFLIGLLVVLSFGIDPSSVKNSLNKPDITHLSFWFMEVSFIIIGAIIMPIASAAYVAMYQYLKDNFGISYINEEPQ